MSDPAHSAGRRVAVGKAARQCQPHPRAGGAGLELERGPATRGAALHVTQAAAGLAAVLAAIGGGAVWSKRKALAVIFDGDAAAGITCGVGEQLDIDLD